MKKHEGLLWILDRPHTEIAELKQKYSAHEEYLKHLFAFQNERYRQNIEFVHSLGLKCDCVGWCYLDFEQHDIGGLLDKIEAFCQKENWLARGHYSCSYDEFETDWFEICAPSIDKIGDGGIPYAIYAYQNRNKPFLLGWSMRVPCLVSERFIEVCKKNNIEGINFCWAKDVGRYESTQYAFMYVENKIKTIACDKGLEYSDAYSECPDDKGGIVYKHTYKYKRHDRNSEICGRLQKIGQHLPRISDVFYDLDVHLPNYYYAEELPERGFAFIQGKNGTEERDVLLIHKKTAEIFLREKMLDAKMLRPALVYDKEIPAGYQETVFEDYERVTSYYDAELAVEMEKEYLRIKSTKRPQRKITTNMALKALREAKRENKEDFGKRMRKEVAEFLRNTEFAELVPYYLVADGGILSDEYRFLDYESAKKYTAIFESEMKKEELYEGPKGIAFCSCADGDNVVLLQNGSVCRISHEGPEVLEEWSTIAEFIYESFNEE